MSAATPRDSPMMETAAMNDTNPPPLPRITLASASRPSAPVSTEEYVPQATSYEPSNQDIPFSTVETYESQEAIPETTEVVSEDYYTSPGRSCAYGNTTVPSGESRLFYQTPTVESGTECVP